MYDPYSVLGLSRNAGEDEVKQAFRRLAKRFHPDTPEGASDKGRRFKDLSIAYEILGDAKKRKAYDRGEIDAHGNPRPGYRPPPEPAPETEPSYSTGASARPAEPPPGASAGPGQRGEERGTSFRSAFERAFGGKAAGSAPKSESRVEDLFAEFFGDRPGAGGRPAGGGDPEEGRFDLQITFEEAVLGGTRRVKLPDGKRLDVRIPVGAKDGHTIRLPGASSAPEGACSVVITVEPHPYFRREGNDILLNLPVTLSEAIHGAKISVPTVHGAVAMTVPGGSSSGQVLRLKGKGIPAHAIHAAGDQLVTLQITLPEKADAELADLVRRWEASHPYDPRKKLGGV